MNPEVPVTSTEEFNPFTPKSLTEFAESIGSGTPFVRDALDKLYPDWEVTSQLELRHNITTPLLEPRIQENLLELLKAPSKDTIPDYYTDGWRTITDLTHELGISKVAMLKTLNSYYPSWKDDTLRIPTGGNHRSYFLSPSTVETVRLIHTTLHAALKTRKEIRSVLARNATFAPIPLDPGWGISENSLDEIAKTIHGSTNSVLQNSDDFSLLRFRALQQQIKLGIYERERIEHAWFVGHRKGEHVRLLFKHSPILNQANDEAEAWMKVRRNGDRAFSLLFIANLDLVDAAINEHLRTLTWEPDRLQLWTLGVQMLQQIITEYAQSTTSTVFSLYATAQLKTRYEQITREEHSKELQKILFL